MIPTQYKCMRGCVYHNWVFTTLKYTLNTSKTEGGAKREKLHNGALKHNIFEDNMTHLDKTTAEKTCVGFSSGLFTL